MSFLAQICSFLLTPITLQNSISVPSSDDEDSEVQYHSGIADINPATGLPMTDGMASMDIGGSPFGMDIHHEHDIHSSHDSMFSYDNHSVFDDCATSCGSAFDGSSPSHDFEY